MAGLAPCPDSFGFWNARSLLSNLSEFKDFLSSTRPLLFGICETWLRAPYTPSFPGYRTFRADRLGGVGGGLALLVRSSVSAIERQVRPFPGGVLEVMAVDVELPAGWGTVALFYNPCRHVTSAEFDFYFGLSSLPLLALGDFNARHRGWDPSLGRAASNSSGLSLHHSLLSFSTLSLSILSPPGLGSRIDPVTGAASTLDLCLGNGFFDRASVSLGPHMGSDHLPLLISFPSLPSIPSCPPRPRWRLVPGGWSSFSSSLATQPPPPLLTPADSVSSFTTALTTAASPSFPLVSRATPAPRCPWWTAECAAVVRAKRRAFYLWRRRPTPAHRTEFRRLNAVARRTLLSAKREAWLSFCSSLSFSSSDTQG